MRADRQTILVATVMAAALSAACEKPVAEAPPPPEVYVTNVVQRDVPVYLELVGQTQGFQDVEIRARVEGFLETVNFREGSFVRKGDLLYEIDRKPLEAALAAGEGRAGHRAGPAREGQQRRRPLHAARGQAGRQPAGARRRASPRRTPSRSQVEAAKAAVEKATLDLGYTRITSPINGLVGTTLVKPGNLVGRGESTLLTTISQIDPMHVPRRRHRGRLPAGHQARSDARRPGPAAGSGIELTLADGTRVSAPGHARTGRPGRRSDHRHPGRRSSTFPTRTTLLRPGQYGRARLLLDNQGRRAAGAAARGAGAAEPLQRRGRGRATTRSRSAT